MPNVQPSASDSQYGKIFINNRISRRLIIIVVVCSTIMSLFASAFQLYFSYRSDMNAIDGIITEIEKSYTNSIENSLWAFNFGQLNIILDGLMSHEDVVYMKIASSSGEKIEKGSLTDHENLISHKFLLAYTDHRNTQHNIGSLIVGLTLDNVYNRLRSKFWVLFLTNTVKTFFVSTILLVIFHLMMARHLKHISTYLKNLKLTALHGNLSLNRQDTNDELTDIVDAINDLENNLQSSYEQLDQTISKLNQSNEQLERFAYSCSHDLQEPVRMVRCYIELLSRELGQDSNERVTQYMHFIKEGAKKSQQLISDVLNYSRIDQEISSKNIVDLNNLLLDIHQTLKPRLNEINGIITWSKMPSVYVNSTQFLQLLQNLISNGLKFNKSAQPHIDISAIETQDAVIIKVQDNGMGIEKEYQLQIFEIFKRLHNQNDFPGSGIGLALCKKIIEQHHGKLTLESELHQGTTFIIELPIVSL